MPQNSYSSLEAHVSQEKVMDKKFRRKPMAIIGLAGFFILLLGFFSKSILLDILSQTLSTFGSPMEVSTSTPQKLKYESTLKEFPYTGTSGVKHYSTSGGEYKLLLVGKIVDVATQTLTIRNPESKSNIVVSFDASTTFGRSVFYDVPDTLSLGERIMLFQNTDVEIEAFVNTDAQIIAKTISSIPRGVELLRKSPKYSGFPEEYADHLYYLDKSSGLPFEASGITYYVEAEASDAMKDGLLAMGVLDSWDENTLRLTFADGNKVTINVPVEGVKEVKNGSLIPIANVDGKNYYINESVVINLSMAAESFYAESIVKL